jgi:hypothetical protein
MRGWKLRELEERGKGRKMCLVYIYIAFYLGASLFKS